MERERGRDTVDPDEALWLVVKRRDLVDCLDDGPRHVRDLQDELSVSRSTAYKGVRELESYDVIERTEQGYELSSFGRSLLGEHDRFRQRTDALCRAKPLLACVPPTDVPPTDVLVDATLTYSTRHAPNHPVHTIEQAIREAESLVGFSSVVLPEYVPMFHDGFVSRGLDAELILERPVIEHMITDYSERFEESLRTGRLTIRETDQALPYGLIVVEEPREQCGIIVHDARGELRGTVISDSPVAIEWGRETYRQYRAQSDALETAD